ncbi:MAG: response regulator [Mariprofundaceae bacterium]
MLRALLVEDSPSVLVTLKMMLVSLSFEVETAECAEDALVLLQAKEDFQPDLIITDLHMPGDNGITLISKIKAKPAFKETPILILTADTEKNERQAAKAAGAMGWLVKPITHARLLDVIRKVLPSYSNRSS